MAIEVSDIRVVAIYETAARQLCKVLRVLPLHVIYELRADRPPFYQNSVLA
jgi:hypothetical protein